MTAPAELPIMLAEIASLQGALSDYAQKMGAHIFDPINNPLPSLDDISDNINVDQLASRVKADKDAAVDLVSGAMTRMVYKSAGIFREITTRRMTKSMIYDQGISDVGITSNEEAAFAGKSVSEVRSTTPYQTEGQ